MPYFDALRRGCVVLGVLSLSACTTLGPDYITPEVTWQDEWQPEFNTLLNADLEFDDAELAFWWHIFEDPALDALIQELRRDNLTLRIAGLRVLETRAQLAIANSLHYPQSQTISGQASYSDSRAINDDSIDPQTQSSYQIGGSVGWEIDFWGKYERSMQTADAAFFASVANQKNIQVLLVAQLVDLYYQYRVLEERVRIARENGDLQKRSFEITQQKFEKGESSELDLQQAKAQYMGTLSTIPDLELAQLKVRNALGLLLGRTPGNIDALQNAALPLPYIDPKSIAHIPAGVLIRRPDIRLHAFQVAAQTAQVGAAEADKYPSISLFGTLGWSGSDQDSSQVIQTFAAGPALNWNVLNYGRLRNNVRVQDARLQQAIEQYQLSVLEAAVDVDNALSELAKNHEKRAYTEASLAAAKRSLTLSTSRYQEGYADFQRVLDAQRTLASESSREVVDHGNHISAVISLYKALGGGWTETDILEYLPESTRERMDERINWGELLIAPIPVEPDWLALQEQATAEQN